MSHRAWTHRIKPNASRLAVYALLILLAVIFIGPWLFALVGSFRPGDEIFRYATPLQLKTFIPTEITLDNYRNLVDMGFHRYLLNSAVVATVGTTMYLFFSSLAAYAFARLRFFGRDFLFVTILSTLMLPFEVVVIPLFIIVKWLGWIDTYTGLIVPGAISSFGIFFLRQIIGDLPRELDDAARVEGCSWFGVYWKIILPQLRSGLISLGILGFVVRWNSFLWPLVVINKDKLKVAQLGLSAIASSPFEEVVLGWGVILAAAVLVGMPVMILFLFLQRYYIRGMALSGFK